MRRLPRHGIRSGANRPILPAASLARRGSALTGPCGENSKLFSRGLAHRVYRKTRRASPPAKCPGSKRERPAASGRPLVASRRPR